MQVASVTSPPEPGTLAMTAVPSSPTSAEGEAEPRQVGDPLPVEVGEIPAGDLAGAFEKVADERPSTEPVPVVQIPAELVDERREEQRGVGHPTGDDDVGPVIQGLQERRYSEVGVRRDQPVAERATGSRVSMRV